MSNLSVTIERDSMLAALVAATRVVERKSTIPILETVMIRAATSSGVQFIGTDLDRELVMPVAAAVHRPGNACVPAHTFLKFVKALPPGPVQCEVAKDWLKLSSGKTVFTLDAQRDPADFPMLELGPVKAVWTMPASDFLKALGMLSYAISTEETRFYLNGIYMHADPRVGRFYLVATDGHQLGRYWLRNPDPAADFDFPENEGAKQRGIIVPRAATAELRNLIRDGGPDILRFTLTGGNAVRLKVEGQHFTLTTKLIDGTFPDYQRVLPAKNSHCLHGFKTEEFLEAIKIVKTASPNNGQGVIKLMPEDRRLVAIVDTVGASASREIEAVWEGPNAYAIGFNIGYLENFLSRFPDGAQIRFGDPGDPIIAEGEQFLGVLMPMRV